MDVRVVAVGKMKEKEEEALVQRYLERFSSSCRGQGIAFKGLYVLLESRLATTAQRQYEEGEKLLKKVPPQSFLVVLDEKGRSLSSLEFAHSLAKQRDQGYSELVVLIGGPDGHADFVRERANLVLSFGKMTWPHQLARLLIAEQLYRAATILSGHPYHRV